MKTMKNLLINPATGKELNIECDVADADRWLQGSFEPAAVCGRHQNGVWIFTRPEDVEKTDEYRSGDPYRVETGLSHESRFHQARTDCTENLVGKYIPDTPGLALLDIGCGEGHLTHHIKTRFSNLQTVYALDMSYTACVRGKQLYPEIEFVVGNAYHPPFQDRCFDVVLMNNIWEHVPDPLRMLEAAARTLKDGGFVVISTPNRFRLGNILQLAKTGKCRLVSTHHVTEYSQGQVVEQLEFMNFSVVDVSAPWIGSCRSKFFRRFLRTILFCRRSRLAFENPLFFVARKK